MTHDVGLAVDQVPGNDPSRPDRDAGAEVLAVGHTLGRHQCFVEAASGSLVGSTACWMSNSQ